MFTQLTPPASEPVSLAVMKAYLRVDIADDDVLISALISAARRFAENHTGRIIAQRDFRIDASTFGDGILPLSPVSSVASVKYLDASKTLQTLTGLDFCPHPLSPQLFSPVAGWPVPTKAWNAVQITCTAGMNPVPEDIQNWIMLRVATAYEQRSAVIDLKTTELGRSFVDGLLDAYCVVTI
ncbi:head-tail connector protein [Iodobacter sp. CM08]|uniref:head-tail connector protein n=1 Tax=Iodobacter sp. CM08 TaxID=3085902 RepID=UPI0029812E99|nr:head-tail connector protein [Iodobacter sp. CM08]MDW5417740.1 head-tail connector protein [Iodobacter sp. CM08]